MKFYLAHPTKDRFFVKEMLQVGLEDEGIQVVNPFLNTEYRAEIFFSDKYQDNIPDMIDAESKHASLASIVQSEIDLIESCDGLIAYVPRETVGASMEILFNSKVFNRGKEATFIYVDVDKESQEEYLEKHPWLHAFGTVVTTFEDLVEQVKAYERR